MDKAQSCEPIQKFPIIIEPSQEPERNISKEKEILEFLQFKRNMERSVESQFSPRPPIKPRINPAAQGKFLQTNSRSLMPKSDDFKDIEGNAQKADLLHSHSLKH
jgi:hypothetical protein